MFSVFLIFLQPLFWLCPNTQFFTALAFASFVELRSQWRDLCAAMKTKTPTHSVRSLARLSVCEKCSIYFKPLRTCGVAGGPTGCGCYLPVKARTECNCWMYDETKGESPFGWPERLNSFPHATASGASNYQSPLPPPL
jgi:hypothetical protein